MTATARYNIGFKPTSDHNPIPAKLDRPLAASQQVGKGQFVTIDATYGRASLNDGTVPGLICAGVGDYAELSETSATAGLAFARLGQRFFSGVPASTIANDGFTNADFGIPFYIADENTPGKLASYSTSHRSLGGLVFGLDRSDETGDTPVLWPGPIAALIARGVIVAGNFCVAGDSRALLLKTAVAETQMQKRGAYHGVITGCKIVVAADLTGSDSDYWTVTVARRTYAAPGTAVTIATGATIAAAGATHIGAATTGTLTAWKEYDIPLTSTAADLVFNSTDTFTIAFATSGSTGGPANAQVNVQLLAKVG